MHPNKTDKGFGFNHFYGVHRNILLFAVPHQSPKSVPKYRFGRQLYELRCDCHWQSIDFDSLRGAPPPGEAMGAAAPIRYTTVNVLTKADSLNCNLKCSSLPQCVLGWCVVDTLLGTARFVFARLTIAGRSFYCMGTLPGPPGAPDYTPARCAIVRRDSRQICLFAALTGQVHLPISISCLIQSCKMKEK